MNELQWEELYNGLICHELVDLTLTLKNSVDIIL